MVQQIVQQYFSADEWSMLMQAPMQAVIGVTLADKTDPVSFLREAEAGIQIVAAEQQRQDHPNDLVRALVAAMNESDAQAAGSGTALLRQREIELLSYLKSLKSAADGRNRVIAYFEEISAVLAAKVTAVQAGEFKEWVLSIAQQVAEAVKEAGFLGVGGERISEAEGSMLRKIERTLSFKV
jgi:collagenase-like PrtC family protease